MENVLFMEDTSGFQSRSGSFLIQPSHPQRLATAMKTSDFSKRYLQGMQLLYHLYSYFLV